MAFAFAFAFASYLGEACFVGCAFKMASWISSMTYSLEVYDFGLAIPIKSTENFLSELKHTKQHGALWTHSSHLSYRIILAVLKNRWHYQYEPTTFSLMAQRLFFSAPLHIPQCDSISVAQFRIWSLLQSFIEQNPTRIVLMSEYNTASTEIPNQKENYIYIQYIYMYRNV